ncbi:cell division protein FtsL [bacterium]|nr:cell division protein FtsL [bacterium]
MARRQRIAPPADPGASRSTQLILWAVVVYASINLAHLILQEYRLLYQGHILSQERVITAEKGRKLKEAIEFARTPEGVERLARKNLGMARPGEQPVRFVSPQGAEPKI